MPQNHSPKERFLRSETSVSAHLRLVNDSMFDVSADAALLQYHMMLVARCEAGQDTDASCHQRLAGAREFLNVFKTLGDLPRTPEPRSDPFNLSQTK